jgi:hypothetical protein
MPKLEIKEVLGEFETLLEYTDVDEITRRAFLVRIQDIFNHIEMHYLSNKAEIDALKIRLKKLERKVG